MSYLSRIQGLYKVITLLALAELFCIALPGYSLEKYPNLYCQIFITNVPQVYRYWIAIEGLCDEIGDDSAILEAHSGPIGVEYPGNAYIDTFLDGV